MNRLFSVLVVVLFGQNVSNAQFFEKINSFYNWANPSKLITDFAVNSKAKSLMIKGIYKSKELTLNYDYKDVRLLDFEQVSSKKDAHLLVTKKIYKDSTVVIAKDAKIKKVAFSYCFKIDANQSKILRITCFNEYGAAKGKMSKGGDSKMYYLHVESKDYFSVCVLENGKSVNYFSVDRSGSTDNYFLAFIFVQDSVRKGVLKSKSLEIIFPIAEKEIALHTLDKKTFFAIERDGKSALFNEDKVNLTGFTIVGEVLSIMDESSYQLRQENYLPAILSFGGDTIFKLTSIDDQFSRLVRLEQNYYLIDNSIGDAEGFVTPKGEIVHVKGSYTSSSVAEGFNKKMKENGLFLFERRGYSYDDRQRFGMFNKDGVIEKYFFVEDSYCSDGLVLVKNKVGKFGFMDKNTNLVIPFQFDKADAFFEGKAYVKIGENAFYIDTKGNKVL